MHDEQAAVLADDVARVGAAVAAAPGGGAWLGARNQLMREHMHHVARLHRRLEPASDIPIRATRRGREDSCLRIRFIFPPACCLGSDFPVRRFHTPRASREERVGSERDAPHVQTMQVHVAAAVRVLQQQHLLAVHRILLHLPTTQPSTGSRSRE